MPYGIILLPDQSIAESLVAFSNEIAPADAIMRLQLDERPPHITLLHVDAEEKAALRWWHGVKEEIGPSVRVSLSGLMFAPLKRGNPYVPEGGLYFGLEAVNTAALRSAHGSVLDAAVGIGARPLGVSGDNFAPHVTLGVLRTFPKQDVDFSSEVFGASFDATPVLGRLGPYGTFPEILQRVS